MQKKFIIIIIVVILLIGLLAAAYFLWPADIWSGVWVGSNGANDVSTIEKLDSETWSYAHKGGTRSTLVMATTGAQGTIHNNKIFLWGMSGINNGKTIVWSDGNNVWTKQN